jgi:hypothetical protein
VVIQMEAVRPENCGRHLGYVQPLRPFRAESPKLPVSDPGGQMAENATVLIIAATHFLFNLDWLVEHEIRLENPFSQAL